MFEPADAPGAAVRSLPEPKISDLMSLSLTVATSHALLISFASIALITR
jgi:hypothetical protein